MDKAEREYLTNVYRLIRARSILDAQGIKDAHNKIDAKVKELKDKREKEKKSK
jgi:hypothetical protein